LWLSDAPRSSRRDGPGASGKSLTGTPNARRGANTTASWCSVRSPVPAQEQVGGDQPARAVEVTVAAGDHPDDASLTELRIRARHEPAAASDWHGVAASEDDRALLVEAARLWNVSLDSSRASPAPEAHSKRAAGPSGVSRVSSAQPGARASLGRPPPSRVSWPRNWSENVTGCGESSLESNRAAAMVRSERGSREFCGSPLRRRTSMATRVATSRQARYPGVATTRAPARRTGGTRRCSRLESSAATGGPLSTQDMVFACPHLRGAWPWTTIRA
jgi:hypothetical protein